MHPITARSFPQLLTLFSYFFSALLPLFGIYWISPLAAASANTPFPETEFSIQGRPVIRWEAIERGTDVLAGNQPHRTLTNPIPYFKFKTAHRAPTDWTLFKVAANASVRFFIRDLENLNHWPAVLKVRSSQGSALFQSVLPEPVLDSRDFQEERGSLFELPPPSLGGDWMVWVSCGPEAFIENQDYSWAAFVSKTEKNPDLELRTVAAVEGDFEKKAVFLNTATGHVEVWCLLKSGEEYQIHLNEGSSIDLITRIPLPPSDRASQFFYSIESSWNPEEAAMRSKTTQIWNLETSADSKHAFKCFPFTAPRINGRGMILMGRERKITLIPESPSLAGIWTIKPDQAVWVRALLKKEPGYLFEEQNSPRPARKSIPDFLESYGTEGSLPGLPLQLHSSENLFNELTHGKDSVISHWRKWRLIHQLLNDPSRTDGGLIAAALAESWARHEPELLSWTHEAIDLQSQAVFFRSLPPASPSMQSTLHPKESGFFIQNYLKPDNSWHWAYQTTTPSPAEWVPKGIFSEISRSNPEIQYHWKAVQAPRRLRLALGSNLGPMETNMEQKSAWPLGHTIEFIVTSFPSGAKQSIYWVPGLGKYLKAHLEQSPEQLVNLRKISETGVSSWFQPVLGNRHYPWIQVDTLEWKIPAGDFHSTLQLGQGSPSVDLPYDSTIHVMLSAQDSRSPRLGETDTQALSSPTAWQDFWTEFRKFSIQDGMIDTPGTAFVADWIPIFRRLHSIQARFHAGIRPKKGILGSNKKTLTLDECQEVIQQARSYEAAGNWLAALEHWDQCRLIESKTLAELSWAGTLRCLSELNEPLLRDRIIKGLCAYPPPNVTEEWILTLQAKAIEEAIEKGVEDEVTMWLARRWVSAPDSQSTRDWLEWLIQIGHAEEALKISQLTPSGWNPGKIIIEAAFEAQWLSTLNKHLTFQTESNRKFWLGMQACYEQDWNGALLLWSDPTDDRAKKWKQFISESLRLRHQWETMYHRRSLENRSGTEKSEAELKWFSDWSQWTSSYPGPVRKTDDMDGWSQVTGLGFLYSGGRDLLAPVALIAPGCVARYQLNSGNPLLLRIRPLADPHAERTSPVQLTIRYASGESEIILVPDSPVSAGLSYIGPGEGLPASETLTTLKIPLKAQSTLETPIEFEVQGGRLLIRVESETPIYDLGAVPLLQSKTLNAWNSHQLEKSFPFQPHSDVLKQSGARVKGLRQIPYENPLKEAENQQISNTIPNSQPEQIAPIEEKKQSSLKTGLNSISPDWISWKKRASQALFSSSPEGMIAEEAVLKQFEMHSKQRGVTDPDFSKILNEIGQRLTWERIRQVESSAGIHRSAALGTQPASPALRIRQALFETPRSRDGMMLQKDSIHWVSNGDYDAAGSQWNIQLRMLLVYYWETDPAEVVIHNSQGDILKKVLLDPKLPEQKFQIPFGEDTHQIGFSIPNRKTQQFIEVTASIKTLSPEEKNIVKVVHVLPEIADKTFHTASEESPIRHKFRSPSWIRIDHLSGSNLITEWRFITDPEGLLELYPKPGESHSYYRIYKRSLIQPHPAGVMVSEAERSETEPGEENQNNLIEAQVPPVPSWGNLNDDILPDSNMRQDSLLRPGRQEDGTWEIHGSAYQRRNIEESTSERFAERFLQFSAERRWHAEHWRSYFRASALHRFREHGGSTLGMGGDWTWHPPFWGGSLTLGGDLYQQKPGGSHWNPHDTEESEWAGRLELTAARRYGMGEQWSLTPSVTVWLRGLSLKQSGAFSSAEIDRDIFTPYKKEHQHGVRLGGTLRWEPTLDQQFWTRLSLASNEDWNLFRPDYYSGQAGWRTIRGSVEAELRYRNVYFQEDADRNKSVWRHFIESRVSWSRWQSSSNRWKTQIMLSYDAVATEWTGWLELSFLWSEGRRLNDYRPSETWFENIWQSRLRE